MQRNIYKEDWQDFKEVQKASNSASYEVVWEGACHPGGQVPPSHRSHKQAWWSPCCGSSSGGVGYLHWQSSQWLWHCEYCCDSWAQSGHWYRAQMDFCRNLLWWQNLLNEGFNPLAFIPIDHHGRLIIISQYLPVVSFRDPWPGVVYMLCWEGQAWGEDRLLQEEE